MPKTHITSPQTTSAIDRLSLLSSDPRETGAEPAGSWGSFVCMADE
jgi:hypothetical protein